MHSSAQTAASKKQLGLLRVLYYDEPFKQFVHSSSLFEQSQIQIQMRYIFIDPCFTIKTKSELRLKLFSLHQLYSPVLENTDHVAWTKRVLYTQFRFETYLHTALFIIL